MQLTGLHRYAKVEIGNIIIHFVASQQTHWLNRETGRRVTLQTGQAINERTNEVYNGFFVIRLNGLVVWAGTNSDILTTPLVGRHIYSGLRSACRLLAGSSYEGSHAREFINGFVPHRSWRGDVVGKPLGSSAWFLRHTFVYPELAYEVDVFNA